MKKLDSNQDKESLLKEVKRLRKENKKLVSQKDKSPSGPFNRNSCPLTWTAFPSCI